LNSDVPSPAHFSDAVLKRRGIMLVLSSPSGAGKTTLANRLITQEENCELSISATTREPRPGEAHGKDYFFMSRPAFESLRDGGAFLEWAEVFGHLYGTPRESVERALSEGKDVLFDIDWQGARQLYAGAPGDVVRLFILPPSREILAARLESRASDSAEVVARRMAGAAQEIAHWDEYDYILVNNDLDESLAALRAILIAERYRRERNPALAPLVRGLLAQR
jgi:guanylate kinase